MQRTDLLTHVELMAGMWRRDVQRAHDMRRALAKAAQQAMDQGHTVQDVADTIGWTQRASVYRLIGEVHGD